MREVTLLEFYGCQNLEGYNAPLSYTQACSWARYHLYTTLPVGSEFTSMAFFSGVQLDCDKRARGSIMKKLEREGLIRSVGITKEDQGRRNNGFATLWSRLK